jgi:hypothetical protein
LGSKDKAPILEQENLEEDLEEDLSGSLRVWILLQVLTVAIIIVLRVTTESEMFIRAFNLVICVAVVFLITITLNGYADRAGMAYKVAISSVINKTGVAVAIALASRAGFLHAGLAIRIAYCVFLFSMHFMIRHKLQCISEMRWRGKDTRDIRECFNLVRFHWALDLFAALLFTAGHIGFLPELVSRALIMGSALAILLMLGRMTMALMTFGGRITGFVIAVLASPMFFACMYFLYWRK